MSQFFTAIITRLPRCHLLAIVHRALFEFQKISNLAKNDILEMNGLSGDLQRGNTMSLNCIKCLTLNSTLCFVNFLMTIFYKTIIGFCQLFILILIIIYFVLPLFILFQNLFYKQLKIKIQPTTYKDLAIGALILFSRIKMVPKKCHGQFAPSIVILG